MSLHLLFPHLRGFRLLSHHREAKPKLRSGEQSTWFKRLETENANLRAALRWTLERQEAEMGLRLGGVLFRFWGYRNHAREGRSWLEQVLSQPGIAEARKRSA